jgi:TrmH family RNA methyltransferase
MGIISSRHNALVKRIRMAIREHAQEIVVEGPKAVVDAIACGWKPIAVVERDVDVSGEVFDALTETRHPQSVIGLFERPRGDAAAILARRDTIAIALDGVQDPGNVGTIVRLAAAFDAAGVLLLPGCADPFAPKAIRASAGAILNVPIADITMAELLWGRPPACRDAAGPAAVTTGGPAARDTAGQRPTPHALLATAMSGAAIDPPARDAILVFGNEGAGVSRELLDAATLIAIPMSARVESLNVASSAAILLARSYDARSRTTDN